MKILSVLLLAACMELSAKGFSQFITLSANKSPLEKVLKEIEKQSNVRFIYSKVTMEDSAPVTVHVSHESLTIVLGLCFAGQPISYVIEEKFIILRKQQEPHQAPAFFHPVNGKVVNEKGESLAGITVLIKGTTTKTMTNNKGEFSFRDITPGSVIVVSGAEFLSVEIKVGTELYLPVTLVQKMGQLDETIVIGYGTTTQRYNTGSVTKVSAQEISRQPVSNPLAALQGRVPGLVVNATSGIPGSAFLVQLRGQNSLNANPASNASIPPMDNPLIIIDGVPFAPPVNAVNQYQSIASPGNSFVYGNEYAGISPYNSINPYDIESIEVLRDASETAIYGSRGANGVILITTKKGKTGKTRLQTSVQSGFSEATRTMKLMNTGQYRTMRKEAIINDGFTPNLNPGMPGYAPDLLAYDSSRYTDWPDYFIGGTAKTTDINLSVSGGSVQTQFLIGAGYHDESYIFPGSFSSRRISFNSKVSHHSKDKKFGMDYSFIYSFDRNNSSGTPSLLKAFTLPPNYPDLVDGNGDINWYNKDQYLFTNPAAYLKQKYRATNYNLITHLRAGYEVLPGLQFQTAFGYNTFDGSERSKIPQSTQHPALSPISYANFGSSDYRTLLIEPQLNYTRQLGKGKLVLMTGGTYQYNSVYRQSQQASGFPNEALMESVGTALSVQNSDQYSEYKYSGVFARVNYILNRRYILHLNGRRDGSSRFGPGKQFGNFGSAGAGWIFSEESIFQKKIPWLSYGKLRGSYGTTGSDNIGNYEYLSKWSSSGSLTIPGMSAYLPQNHYNPDFSWSVTNKLEAAAELGFLNDRLLFTAAWFRNRCGNQLVTFRLPSLTGFTGVTANFPALVQNSGWEFTLRSTILKSAKLNWTASFNLSIPKNKLVSFPGIERTAYHSIYKVGYSLSTLDKFIFSGVDPATGIYEYASKNGVVYNPSTSTDLAIIGNLDPKCYGGLQNMITWKNFNLEFLLEFRKQSGANYLQQIYQNYPPGTSGNLPVRFLDRWQQAGDQAPLQRFTSLESGSSPAVRAAQNFARSSAAYGDASFIRLRTLSLTYEFPASWRNKMKAEAFNIFLHAQNLVTITSYEGHDLENKSYFSLPPLRTIVLGLQLNF